MQTAVMQFKLLFLSSSAFWFSDNMLLCILFWLVYLHSKTIHCPSSRHPLKSGSAFLKNCPVNFPAGNFFRTLKGSRTLCIFAMFFHDSNYKLSQSVLQKISLEHYSLNFEISFFHLSSLNLFFYRCDFWNS